MGVRRKGGEFTEDADVAPPVEIIIVGRRGGLQVSRGELSEGVWGFHGQVKGGKFRLSIGTYELSSILAPYSDHFNRMR